MLGGGCDARDSYWAEELGSRSQAEGCPNARHDGSESGVSSWADGGAGKWLNNDGGGGEEDDSGSKA